MPKDRRQYDREHNKTPERRLQDRERGKTEKRKLWYSARAKTPKSKAQRAAYAKTYRAKIWRRFYRLGYLNQIPPWLTDDHWAEMQNMHERAKEITVETGVAHVVDHIHPLKSPVVSGLHVPWNLQILSHVDNLAKKNRLIDGAG